MNGCWWIKGGGRFSPITRTQVRRLKGKRDDSRRNARKLEEELDVFPIKRSGVTDDVEASAPAGGIELVSIPQPGTAHL
jgi:hypothetical protein